MLTAFTLSRIFSSPRGVLNLLRFAAVVGCAAGLMAAPSVGQETASPAPTPLQVTTELVKLDVGVMDKRGQLVAGLKSDDFRVLDNGAEQPLTFFAPVEAPAQILVLIETSPAVYLIENEHLLAAYALLDGLATDDQVALATYDQGPRAVLALTPDKRALLAALNQVQYTMGMAQLNLYDSVSTVLDWLEPATGKKALLVLTTGIDSSPTARWDALVEKARARDVVIFPVALGGSLRGGPNKKTKKAGGPLSVFTKGYAALGSLAAITGGRAYFPESAKDFAPIYGEIAAMLRHEYVLGIAPAHDGEFHLLGVEVLKNGATSRAATSGSVQTKGSEYHVFVRQGYQAPPAAR
jgi:VWFA-related protein